MTRYLLAGGGTAGHVNPLLAVADELVRRHPDAEIIVLGTAEGLEARLVPARGYELVTIPKLPFPRRPGRDAVAFPLRWYRTVKRVRAIIRERRVDAVAGFGGYAAAPAYVAAHREHIALAIHESNAKPGMASRLGARRTRFVGVALQGTPLRSATWVGMPLRREIEDLDGPAARAEAKSFFGLDDRPTLLVTGGSLGARRINSTMLACAQDVLDAGYQVLHIQGPAHEFEDPQLPGYHLVDYCDRMELALAAADAAVSRSGGIVSELTLLGLPAVYVPYAVGNGEQRYNAQAIVDAGGGILVDDAAFTPAAVRETVLPLLRDPARLAAMAQAAASLGVRDGSKRFADLVDQAVAAAG
ncbi:UDP-N-acetylglucosamine--N-acetylmuramyl-(pentapeptide) pyrophosphoryl-undecaprenol N-acetylglucosamine transferase [Gryllotalpicola sp.]|uniref:UDP-N-acetylglucosamine--N-acetylmuramyl- (pentapeptide) pyrophosphoryl-undecaprenol N-acetylglucosamine transferase n=1 Tax=Gryllotalpicola sp. TaxID=1932787 RepID=UPI002628CD0B|nr:UDP-N-acetylglucosamine--N-acetylmuramyl-(pentapeptide) pyrophosphoryl-undecaprenol N-acetylglucosamine transferase [Gryllotalpicola sp.]